MENHLEIISKETRDFIDVNSEKYNQMRQQQLEGIETSRPFGDETLQNEKYIQRLVVQQQTRASLMALDLETDTIVPRTPIQEKFQQAMSSMVSGLETCKKQLKRMIEEAFLIKDFSLLEKIVDAPPYQVPKEGVRQLIHEHYKTPRFSMVYHFFEEIFSERSLRPQILPEIMKQNVFRDEWRIRLMFQFMLQNGFTHTMMHDMLEVHRNDFLERKLAFLSECRPSIERYFEGGIDRLRQYGISQDLIEKRLEETSFDLVDSLTIFDRDLEKVTYDLSSGRICIPDYLYLEKPGSLMPRTLRVVFYALAGRGARKDNKGMHHTRLGFEELDKKQSLSWLNEMVADYLFHSCLCGMPAFSEELRDHPITLLSSKGREPFDPALFIKAFLENDQKEAGAKRPLWNELKDNLARSYEDRFLSDMSSLIRGQGLEAVTKLLQKDWNMILLRNYHRDSRPPNTNSRLNTKHLS